jgi:hypothetical protein
MKYTSKSRRRKKREERGGAVYRDERERERARLPRCNLR